MSSAIYYVDKLTYIDSGNPGTNYGSAIYGRVFDDKAGKGGEQFQATLMEVSIADLCGHGYTVDPSSHLDIYVESYTWDTDPYAYNIFYLTRITTSWDEDTVTFNTPMSGTLLYLPTCANATGWYTLLTGANFASYLQAVLDTYSGDVNLRMYAYASVNSHGWIHRSDDYTPGDYRFILTVVYGVPAPAVGGDRCVASGVARNVGRGVH